jgi:hypothetical protein
MLAHHAEKRKESLMGTCLPLRKRGGMTRRLWVLEWLFSGESKSTKLRNSISEKLLKKQAKQQLARSVQSAVKVKNRTALMWTLTDLSCSL